MSAHFACRCVRAMFNQGLIRTKFSATRLHWRHKHKAREKKKRTRTFNFVQCIYGNLCVCVCWRFFCVSVEQTGRNSQMNAANMNKHCRKHDSNHNQQIVVVRINFYDERVIHPKEVKKKPCMIAFYLYWVRGKQKDQRFNSAAIVPATISYASQAMRSVYAISFTIRNDKTVIHQWQEKKANVKQCVRFVAVK